MWLMTRYGFFSIVCARGKGGRVLRGVMMVRARKKEHLERIKELNTGLGPIVETDDTDYPYRIIARRRVVKALVNQITRDIDYGNFKSAAAQDDTTGDGTYITFLHAVWAAGLRMTPPRARTLYGSAFYDREQVATALENYQYADTPQRANGNDVLTVAELEEAWYRDTMRKTKEYRGRLL